MDFRNTVLSEYTQLGPCGIWLVLCNDLKRRIYRRKVDMGVGELQRGLRMTAEWGGVALWGGSFRKYGVINAQVCEYILVYILILMY